jgi:hypothetical protein
MWDDIGMWKNVGKIVEMWDFSHNVGKSGLPASKFKVVTGDSDWCQVW